MEKQAPLRILLVWDNLAGHLTPDLVIWLFHHGVMPFYFKNVKAPQLNTDQDGKLIGP